MEPYIFFVFFPAIVLPTGEIKTLTHHVTECPSKEIVEQMHVPKLNRGEIVDWAAACSPVTVLLDVPTAEKIGT